MCQRVSPLQQIFTACSTLENGAVVNLHIFKPCIFYSCLFLSFMNLSYPCRRECVNWEQLVALTPDMVIFWKPRNSLPFQELFWALIIPLGLVLEEGWRNLQENCRVISLYQSGCYVILCYSITSWGFETPGERCWHLMTFYFFLFS